LNGSVNIKHVKYTLIHVYELIALYVRSLEVLRSGHAYISFILRRDLNKTKVVFLRSLYIYNNKVLAAFLKAN